MFCFIESISLLQANWLIAHPTLKGNIHHFTKKLAIYLHVSYKSAKLLSRDMHFADVEPASRHYIENKMQHFSKNQLFTHS